MWSVFLSDLKVAFTFDKNHTHHLPTFGPNYSCFTLTLKVEYIMYTKNFERYEDKTQLEPKS